MLHETNDNAARRMPAIDTLALAPMEGVTDDVLREVFVSLGGLDYVVTEFVRVSSEPLPARVLLRECPELEREGCAIDGVAVHLQLLGGDPGRVAATARVAEELGARAIDLNFGCPAPTVNRHDGGATLLKDPTRIHDVVAAVRAAVSSRVAVSAKVRLGWDAPDRIAEIARAAEAGGASLLTVHARTRAQGYAPPVDWRRVGEARESVSIPVVANGDIVTLEDLARCADESGCTRFMLGRGAIARPELFRLARGLDSAPWPVEKRLALIDRFIDASLSRGPGRERVALARAKQWLRAMASADARARAVFERAKRVDELEAFRAELREGARNDTEESTAP
jgi:tRNA-dihydrouridine synthase C